MFYIIFLLFLSPPALTKTTDPSFSYSKKEGLQVLKKEDPSKKEEVKKESVKKETELTVKKKEVSPDGKKSETEVTVKKEESQETKTEEASPALENEVSEEFLGTEEEGKSFSSFLKDDVSWFFQTEDTPHKIGIVPVGSYTQTQGTRLGLRLLGYGSDKDGYYAAGSVSKYIFRPFYRIDGSYISSRQYQFYTQTRLVYDTHYENLYGELGENGLSSSLDDANKLHAKRFFGSFSIFWKPTPTFWFVGGSLQAFSRFENDSLQEDKEFFDNEAFLFVQAFAGYDSRKNWKDPREGSYHKLNFGCKANFDLPHAYCRSELDLRFYFPLAGYFPFPIPDSTVLAVRGFLGTSFFNEASYSLKYSLSGLSAFQQFSPLRGFKQNRFLGDQMSFAQAELRIPVWSHYVEAAVFSEIGSITNYKESFDGYVIDFGGGLRFGLPPDYDMKLRVDVGGGYDLQDQINYNVIVSFLQAF